VITVFTGLDILPIKELDRKFIAIKRMIMEDYGLMFLLIPMGVISIVYKFKIKNNKWIILGFLAVFLAFLLALTRRYIFGTLIYFALAAVLYNYMYHKPLVPIKKTITAMFYLGIFFVALGLAFPQYTEAGIVAGQETWNVIVRGETSTGLKDSRLGLGKTFIQDKIVESPFFGTGFDNRWRTKEGDTMGYEASDYPFLGAIAMYGIVGLLFFLPIYIVILKRMYFDVKQLRARYINLNSFEAYALIAFLLYFIYDFLLYMNWFLPISVIKDSKWYIFVGMFFACRRAFYNTVDTDPAIQGAS
jgi:O-antigen ligase